MKDLLPGGKGDGKPDSAFRKDELKKGIKHEAEHTKSLPIRKEITKDHLTEDDRYYEHLDDAKIAFWQGFEKAAGIVEDWKRESEEEPEKPEPVRVDAREASEWQGPEAWPRYWP